MGEKWAPKRNIKKHATQILFHAGHASSGPTEQNKTKKKNEGPAFDSAEVLQKQNTEAYFWIIQVWHISGIEAMQFDLDMSGFDRRWHPFSSLYSAFLHPAVLCGPHYARILGPKPRTFISN